MIALVPVSSLSMLSTSSTTMPSSHQLSCFVYFSPNRSAIQTISTIVLSKTKQASPKRLSLLYSIQSGAIWLISDQFSSLFTYVTRVHYVFILQIFSSSVFGWSYSYVLWIVNSLRQTRGSNNSRRFTVGLHKHRTFVFINTELDIFSDSFRKYHFRTNIFHGKFAVMWWVNSNCYMNYVVHFC